MPHIMEMHNLPSELLQYRPQAQGLPLVHTCVQAVAYLEGGASASQPPPPVWPDRRDFCNYFGIILASFRDKIAATSDQMRFLGRKML